MHHSLIEGSHQVAQGLTCVYFKRLHAFLLVLLSLEDLDFLLLEVVKLLLVLCPLLLVDLQLVVHNRLFNRADHPGLLLSEDLCDFL